MATNERGSDFINKKTMQVIKWCFVLVVVSMIIYTFRAQAEPILRQLSKTKWWVILSICVASIAYECMEGWVTHGLAKEYQPDFSYRHAVESAFYCSFYRAATLGSGAGVAAVYYFNEKGIPVSKGMGMYAIEYVLHKLSIAVFSIISFFVSYYFMMEYFSEYTYMLVGGYALTFVIALAMVAVCCFTRIHDWIFALLDKINRNHKLDDKIAYLKEQSNIMEEASAFLLKKKSLMVSTVAKNLLKLACWYGIPFLVFMGTGIVTLPQVFAITSLSVMLAAVIPAPAGIGSTELMFALLFSMVVGSSSAGSASLLYRFATFVFPFAIGALILVKRRIEKRI